MDPAQHADDVTDPGEPRTVWLAARVEADAESVEPVAELLAGAAAGGAIRVHELQRAEGSEATERVEVRAAVSADAVERIERGLWHLGRIGWVGALDLAPCTAPREALGPPAAVLRASARVRVVAERDAAVAPTPGEACVALPIGGGFGTGFHPTTALALSLLDQLALDPDARVLDAGAGSGILAIAAAQLGAGHTDAVEIDAAGVRALAANVASNGVADRVAALQGDATTWQAPAGGYSVVLANMTAGVLCRAAASLARALAPGGVLVLSGLLVPQEPEVRAAYEAQGCALVSRRTRADWVALRWQRR